MTERLRKETIAIPGESARGLFARACGDHNIPNSWIILKRVGSLYRHRVLISEHADLDLASLEHLIHVRPGELCDRRYEPTGPKSVSFYGLNVKYGQIETRTRRFSPAALAKSDAPHPPHMRATWELRGLPYSMEGWDILQDRCGCGVRQGWVRITKVDRCDDCGRRLADAVKPVFVPEELRDALRLPALLASPIATDHAEARAMLPEVIASAGRQELYDVIMRIRRLIEPPEATSMETLLVLHDAATAVLQWPSGLVGMASRWNGASKFPNQLSSYRRLDGEKNRYVQRNKAGDHPETRLLGLNAAARLTHVSTETLLAFRAEGHLKRHLRPHGNRMTIAFERVDVLAFAQIYRARLSTQDVATKLGITKNGVEQLIALGKLVPSGPSLEAEHPHFLLGDLADLFAAIEGGSSHIDDAVSLREAIKTVGGGLKPWGPIVIALAEGRLPYLIKSGDGPASRRIAISLRSLPTLRAFSFDASRYPQARFSSTMIQRDALETLNTYGNILVLDGLRSKGSGPKYYLVADVASLANNFITLPEIAGRLNMIPADAYYLLLDGNLVSSAPGLWDRGEIERRLFS